MVEQHQLNGQKYIFDNPQDISDTFPIPEVYHRRRQSDLWARSLRLGDSPRRRIWRDFLANMSCLSVQSTWSHFSGGSSGPFYLTSLSRGGGGCPASWISLSWPGYLDPPDQHSQRCSPVFYLLVWKNGKMISNWIITELFFSRRRGIFFLRDIIFRTIQMIHMSRLEDFFRFEIFKVVSEPGLHRLRLPARFLLLRHESLRFPLPCYLPQFLVIFPGY